MPVGAHPWLLAALHHIVDKHPRSLKHPCAGAGHYCGDTCVCHNCHNTQDHKDLVTQTIAYTRSRNPASFEAKVVALPPRFCHSLLPSGQ